MLEKLLKRIFNPQYEISEELQRLMVCEYTDVLVEHGMGSSQEKAFYKLFSKYHPVKELMDAARDVKIMFENGDLT